MQYDPDQPEGPGLRAWEDWLKARSRPPADSPQPKAP